MALEVYYRPPTQWHPVYRPVVFQYRSDLYPNVTQRESNLPIIAIRNPTLAELSSYPQLDATDVLVEHAYQDPSAFYAGASIDIYNTSDGLYSGVYRVSERLTNELMVIDAEDVGIDTGGRFRIHYTNFTVFVEVLSENMTEPVTFTVMPTKTPTPPRSSLPTGTSRRCSACRPTRDTIAWASTASAGSRSTTTRRSASTSPTR